MSASTTRTIIDYAIACSARFLVVHDGRLVATFVNEDDALLFEGELAELDLVHGVESARCEVRDTRGHRLGGYLITAGKLCAFVRREARGTSSRPRRGRTA